MHLSLRYGPSCRFYGYLPECQPDHPLHTCHWVALECPHPATNSAWLQTVALTAAELPPSALCIARTFRGGTYFSFYQKPQPDNPGASHRSVRSSDAPFHKSHWCKFHQVRAGSYENTFPFLLPFLRTSLHLEALHSKPCWSWPIHQVSVILVS